MHLSIHHTSHSVNLAEEKYFAATHDLVNNIYDLWPGYTFMYCFRV